LLCIVDLQFTVIYIPFGLIISSTLLCIVKTLIYIVGIVICTFLHTSIYCCTQFYTLLCPQTYLHAFSSHCNVFARDKICFYVFFFVVLRFLCLIKTRFICLCCDVGWLEGFLPIWCERSMVADTCDIHDFHDLLDA
jgi:hypothetical protein